MKYKLLLVGGKKAWLNDFFMYATDEFQCISSSIYWEDIQLHLDYIEPDVLVGFYEEDNDEIINRIRSMKNYKRYEKVPVIMLADEGSSMALAKKAYGMIALTIQRPIGTDQMFSMIRNFLRTRTEKKEEESEDAGIAASGDPEVNALLKDVVSFEKNMKADMKKEGKKHILVVDDDRSILKLLKSALEQEYDVTTVLNGRMAEKFLETKTTDLILLDYEMPIETGPEVLQNIKKKEETADIPVVFMTGVASRSKIQEVMLLGPQGYLLKPVDMDKLFTTIKNLIG